jgi:hypothetical protein
MKTKFFLPLFLSLSIAATAFSLGSTDNQSKETTVLICNSQNAYAYHSHKCSGLQRCKSEILNIKVSEAKKRGKSACKICYKH